MKKQWLSSSLIMEVCGIGWRSKRIPRHSDYKYKNPSLNHGWSSPMVYNQSASDSFQTANQYQGLPLWAGQSLFFHFYSTADPLLEEHRSSWPSAALPVFFRIVMVTCLASSPLPPHSKEAAQWIQRQHDSKHHREHHCQIAWQSTCT